MDSRRQTTTKGASYGVLLPVLRRTQGFWREDRLWGSEWVAAAVCGAEREGTPVLGDESDY